MIIGAYAMGAGEGYVYCRAEYPIAIKHLRIALAQAEEHGLLGDDILGTGFSFHLTIKEGAGAFVCGEETALMASIEGKRGMPRTRPPFPAVVGPVGQADQHQQRRDLGERGADHRQRASTGTRRWAPRTARAPRSSRWPASSRTPASSRSPWASPCAS